MRRTVDVLRALGRADLGRLYEGHLNAVKLVALNGDPGLVRKTFRETFRDVADGSLLGVWGAVGARPLAVTASSALHWTLRERLDARWDGTATRFIEGFERAGAGDVVLARREPLYRLDVLEQR